MAFFPAGEVKFTMLPGCGAVLLSPVEFRQPQGNQTVLGRMIEQLWRTAVAGTGWNPILAAIDLVQRFPFTVKVGQGVEGMDVLHQLLG